jgi:3-oxoacyl-[acyl-carrier protein] reductase
MPKTIIVTGSASGIGLACARGLLAEGHNVTAVDIAALPDSLVAGAKDRCLALRADVTSLDECRDAVGAAAKAFGAVDGLIHMAAIHSTRTWDAIDADHFNRILAVNVTGSFLMARAVGDHMAAHGGGAIVLASSASIVSSGAGGQGRGGPAYVTSKAAIIGLTRALARSLGRHKIRVNAVSPGATDTPMTADYSEDARKNVAARALLGRFGRPEDIASVAMFLVSDAAGYMTGAIVNVNGGGSFS